MALLLYSSINENSKPSKRIEKKLKPSVQERPTSKKKVIDGYSAIEDALKQLPIECQRKTVIADREADIYALLSGLKHDLQLDYVIRSKHNRPLGEGSTLKETIASWDQQYSYTTHVPATDKRSAHEALLHIKFGKVELKKAEGKTLKNYPQTLTTWVVEAAEAAESVVGKEDPIEWTLFTSHAVEDIEQALQIISWYKERWNIEQLFRTLKNKGLCFESSQVSSYEKLQKLMVLALIGAVKVLQLVRARDHTTQQSMQGVFSESEQQCMYLINKRVEGKTEKLHNPYPRNSLAFAAWVIGRLGGWSGYKSQRPPGPIDMLNGLKIFYQRMQGYNMIVNS